MSGTYGYSALSSPTPLPTAFAIVTFPARAAFTMPGTAEHRVAAEVQRVEVVVVDAAVDDVDALQPLGRAHRDDVVVAHEVAALDELDAHLPGEERVLEVRGVVHARREHDDARVVDRRGRRAATRAAGSGSRRPAGPGGSRTARGRPGSSPAGSRSRTRCPTGCAGCPRAPGTGPPRRGRGRCRTRGPGRPAVGAMPDRGPLEVGRGHDQAARDDAVGEDPARAVDVGEERLEREHPLADPGLDRRPLLGRQDPGHEVERERPLLARELERDARRRGRPGRGRRSAPRSRAGTASAGHRSGTRSAPGAATDPTNISS